MEIQEEETGKAVAPERTLGSRGRMLREPGCQSANWVHTWVGPRNRSSRQAG